MVRVLLLLILMFGSVFTAVSQVALPRISVACVRELPGHSRELGSQVLMGVPVSILDKQGEWYKVKTVDGYNGYIISSSLKEISDSESEDWKPSDREIFIAFKEDVIWDAKDKTSTVSDIVPGCIVEMLSTDNILNLTKVMLPDGRIGYIDSEKLLDLKEWASQEYNPDLLINYAKAQMGKPYLWGGTSCKSMDCSGLSWVAAWLNGRILPRNSSVQARIGVEVENPQNLCKGNLMFFGSLKTRRVNHVAIYDTDNKYVESSGWVKTSKLIPNDNRKKNGYLHSVDISNYPNVADSCAEIFFEN